MRPTRAGWRPCIVAPLSATGPTPRATVTAPVQRCNGRGGAALAADAPGSCREGPLSEGARPGQPATPVGARHAVPTPQVLVEMPLAMIRADSMPGCRAP